MPHRAKNKNTSRHHKRDNQKKPGIAQSGRNVLGAADRVTVPYTSEGAAATAATAAETPSVAETTVAPTPAA